MAKSTLTAHRKHSHIKLSLSDKIFYSIVDVLMVITIIIMLVPIMNILASSFSSGAAVNSGKVGIIPVDFTLDGYKMILKSDKLVLGYKNTIFYTVVGTAINVFMVVIGAYPMSRKDFKPRHIIMKIYSFAMYFSGGLIAQYLLYQDMGLVNSRWVMLLPGAFSISNMIVTRTYFETNIPDELLESSKMDGCSDFRFLLQMVIPLSKAIIAVMILFHALGHWNAYFNAYLYLSDERKYPLSLFFQQLIGGVVTQGMTEDANNQGIVDETKDLLKYTLIVVTTLPACCAYPLVQKYFIKGVKSGAVKG